MVAGLRYKFDLVLGTEAGCQEAGEGEKRCQMDVYSVPWQEQMSVQWDNVKCGSQEEVEEGLTVVRQLFLGSIPPTVDMAELVQYLRRFGVVHDLSVESGGGRRRRRRPDVDGFTAFEDSTTPVQPVLSASGHVQERSAESSSRPGGSVEAEEHET